MREGSADSGARAHLTCATAGASALHATINVLSSLTSLIKTVVMTGKLLLGHEQVGCCESH